MSWKGRLTPLLLVVMLVITIGCATPTRVNVASQAQIEGFRDLKSQLRGLHRQIEDLLRTYADLTVEGHQRERMLGVIVELVEEDPPRSLDEADQVIEQTRDEAASELAGELQTLRSSLGVLQESRDAALTEVDNLIALHSIINDYLQIDLTVSKEDIEEITEAIRELRDPGGRR